MYKRQVSEVLHSRAHNDGVRALVKGVMVESYLVEGAQKISDHMVRGQSITDPCLGWEDTEKPVSYTHLDVYKRQRYARS